VYLLNGDTFLTLKFSSVPRLYQLLYRVIEKMDGIWNRYNLKSTGRIYKFGVLKYSQKFKVLDLP